MTSKEIVEAVAEFVKILTQWPIITLIIVLVLRNHIGNAIPSLADRVRKISVGGNFIDFAEIQSGLRGFDPALRGSIIGSIRPNAIVEGETDAPDEDEPSTDEAESSEDDEEHESDLAPDLEDFGRSLDELQGRGR